MLVYYNNIYVPIYKSLADMARYSQCRGKSERNKTIISLQYNIIIDNHSEIFITGEG